MYNNSQSVEMVDKHASEACAFTGVGVQIPSLALFIKEGWQSGNAAAC